MARHALSVAALLTAWIFPCATQGESKIAFQTMRDAQWEIYVMNVDGSDQTNLTNHSSRDIDPAWSPDGSKIAFASDRRGKLQIFVMNGDGTEQTQLTQQPGHHIRPAWSPDGTQIAFASDREGDYDIYVMQADGSDAVNVTQHPGIDLTPSWSPDGTQLAFMSQRDRPDVVATGSMDTKRSRMLPEPSDIFVMDALGGAAINLTIAFTSSINREPAWAPVGGRILYVFAVWRHEFSRLEEIMSVDAVGGERTSMGFGSLSHPNSGFNNLHGPAWSPDGHHFVFSSWHGASVDLSGARVIGLDFEIWVTSAAGGEPVNLTQTPGSDERPAWSPNQGGPAGDTSVEGTAWGAIKAGARRDRPKGRATD